MIYFGRVEQTGDPLKLGRVKVRIFGIHSSNSTDETAENYLPAEDLLWMSPMYPASGVSNLGIFSEYKVDSIVLCYPYDGDKQHWIILGSIYHLERDPITDKNKREVELTSNLHPLARGVEDETIAHEKLNRIIGIPGNEPDVTYDEPENTFSASYGRNNVFATMQHVVEYDDTPAKSRFHYHHKASRNFHTINNDGSDITKSYGDVWNICEGNSTEYIKKDKRLLIDGVFEFRAGTTNFLFDKLLNIVSGKDMTITSVQGKRETVAGITRDSGGRYRYENTAFHKFVNVGEMDFPAEATNGILYNALHNALIYKENIEPTEGTPGIAPSLVELIEGNKEVYVGGEEISITNGIVSRKYNADVTETFKNYTINIESGSSLTINCGNTAFVLSSTGISITTGTFKVDATDLIELIEHGKTSCGVVVENSVCPFIVSKHLMASEKVKASL